MKPIVIIHGWSDRAGSFEPLARRLKRQTGRPVEQLLLGDYISMDDEVKMSDLTSAMQHAWTAAGLSTEPNSVDAIVHSTGGLVIRDWMHRFWTSRGGRPPVHNLVMLAPANFGSPLAHKGRSLLGRVVKGMQSDKRFQTGTHILKALEMAGTYTWRLAEKDRFSENAFSSGGVLCTVIVGNTGYGGIRGLANEDGSDGTVYVATANLNCARLSIDVARDTNRLSAGPVTDSVGRTAFLVVDKLDHSEIKGEEKFPARVKAAIVDALTVDAAGFDRWCEQCDAKTGALVNKYSRSTRTEFHAFQNTVFRVGDDHGADIRDYVIEFYGDFTDTRDVWAGIFNKNIVAKAHPCSDNPAYRSFMINTTLLDKTIDKVNESLRISLSALPDLTDEDETVGYRTFGDDDIGELELNSQALRSHFRPHRTMLIDFTLPRYQSERVFRFR